MRKGRSYSIDGSRTQIWFTENLSDLEDFLSSYARNSFWVFDEKVLGMFPKCDLPFNSFVASWGDTQHDMDHVMELIIRARSLSLGKETRWIVIGGSTVSRIASLASLLFCGGTKLMLVPTTLLAMNDSSICGRCGISFPGDRNLCSTIHQADDVVIDLRFLPLSNDVSLRNGGGEMIKHAVLSEDPSLFDFLMDNRNSIKRLDPESSIEAIETSIGIKIDLLVSKRRTELEFGHRFAYGFMDDNVYGKKHGPAIAWEIGRAHV